jgi:hypothetical protein
MPPLFFTDNLSHTSIDTSDSSSANTPHTGALTIQSQTCTYTRRKSKNIRTENYKVSHTHTRARAHTQAAHLVKLAVKIVQGMVPYHHVLHTVVEVNLSVPIKVLTPALGQRRVVGLRRDPQQVRVLPTPPHHRIRAHVHPSENCTPPASSMYVTTCLTILAPIISSHPPHLLRVHSQMVGHAAYLLLSCRLKLLGRTA